MSLLLDLMRKHSLVPPSNPSSLPSFDFHEGMRKWNELSDKARLEVLQPVFDVLRLKAKDIRNEWLVLFGPVSVVALLISSAFLLSLPLFIDKVMLMVGVMGLPIALLPWMMSPSLKSLKSDWSFMRKAFSAHKSFNKEGVREMLSKEMWMGCIRDLLKERSTSACDAKTINIQDYVDQQYDVLHFSNSVYEAHLENHPPSVFNQLLEGLKKIYLKNHPLYEARDDLDQVQVAPPAYHKFVLEKSKTVKVSNNENQP